MADSGKEARRAAFDEFFNDYFAKVLFVPPLAVEPQPPLKVDVSEAPDKFIVRAEIAGARAEGIVVDYRDGVLEVIVAKELSRAAGPRR